MRGNTIGDVSIIREDLQSGQHPRVSSTETTLDNILEPVISLAGTSNWFEFPITNPTFITDVAEAQGLDRVNAITQAVAQGAAILHLLLGCWL